MTTNDTGPGPDEGGFWIVPRPDPDRRITISQAIDFRLELDEQTFDALDERIAQLENAVAVLEGLVLGTTKDPAA